MQKIAITMPDTSTNLKIGFSTTLKYQISGVGPDKQGAQKKPKT